MFTASTHTTASTFTYYCRSVRFKNTIKRSQGKIRSSMDLTGFTTHTDVFDCPELTKPLKLPTTKKSGQIAQLLLLGLHRFLAGSSLSHHQVTECIPFDAKRELQTSDVCLASVSSCEEWCMFLRKPLAESSWPAN